MDGVDPKHADSPLEFGIEVRIDHLFLVPKPFERAGFVERIDLLATYDLPVGFAGPAGIGEGLRVLAFLSDAEFIGVLAEPHIGRPMAQLRAARDIDYRHRPSCAPPAGRLNFRNKMSGPSVS